MRLTQHWQRRPEKGRFRAAAVQNDVRETDAATMSNMDHQFYDAVSGRSAHVSAHPAFPAIVAAWFAALFGFGWMLLPGAVVDGLAGAAKLDAVSDNFVRPVGFIGRSMLAALLGVLSGVCGWAVARRIGAMQGHTQPPAPRALDISELEGELPVMRKDEGDAPRKRRRALAVAEGDVPSYVPPVQAAQEPVERRPFDPLPFSAVGVDSDLPDRVAGMDRHPISELPESADSAHRGEPGADQAPIGHEDGEVASNAAEAQDLIDIGGWHEEEAEGELPGDEFSQAAAPPIPFSAPSFSRESRAAEISAGREPAPAQSGASGREQFLSQIENADLESLGTVQLAERLAISIARRRERAAAIAEQTSAPDPAQPFPPSPSIPVGADHSAASTAFDSAPEALHPIRFDFAAEEGEEEDLGLSLPTGAIRPSPGSPLAVRSPRQPRFDEDAEKMEASFIEPDPGEEEPEDSGRNYGSLLATRRDLDLGREHVRIDEPEPQIDDIEPAVIFPGEARGSEAFAEVPPATDYFPQSLRRFDLSDAPAECEETAQSTSAKPASFDRAEADRSLRGALEALQRSGGKL